MRIQSDRLSLWYFHIRAYILFHTLTFQIEQRSNLDSKAYLKASDGTIRNEKTDSALLTTQLDAHREAQTFHQ